MITLIPTLVLVEHDGRAFKRASLNAITLARELGAPFGLVVVGSNVAAVAESVRQFGALTILLVDDAALGEALADRHAEAIAQLARKYAASTVVGSSTSYTRDVLPRVAALLDAAMASDVIAVATKDGATCFKRMTHAGRLCATIRLAGPIRVVSVRATAFPTAAPSEIVCGIETLDIDPTSLPQRSQFISREQPTSHRPDLGEAKIIVSGGRPLRDKATFDGLIGGLADALGGAVGATRAAVDAGMAANQCQVGQTAATVAPELYFAIGISGAVQHIAGVMDSKVIVAINRDPDAPIFQVATYGLVGDLHEIVPRLIKAIRP